MSDARPSSLRPRVALVALAGAGAWTCALPPASVIGAGGRASTGGQASGTGGHAGGAGTGGMATGGTGTGTGGAVVQAGHTLWSRAIGTAANDEGTGIAVMPVSGGVAVTGTLGGYLGGIAGKTTGVFLASYQADGTQRWLKTYGDTPSTQTGSAVVTASPGDLTAVESILFGGTFTGTMDIGWGSPVSAVAGSSAFAGVVDASATALGFLDANYGNTPAPSRGTAVAVLRSASMSFLAGADTGLLLASYSPAKGSPWLLSQAPGAVPSGIATDSMQHLIVAGAYAQQQPFAASGTAKSTQGDGFVAQVTLDPAPQGTVIPVWSVDIGGAGSAAVNGVAVGSDDGPVVVGDCSGQVGIGTRVLGSPMVPCSFVAKLDTNGGVAWAVTLLAQTAGTAAAVAVDPGSGAVVVTGAATGGMELAGPPVQQVVPPAGGGFVLKLDANGAFGWARSFPGVAGKAIAVDSKGIVYVTGQLTGTANLGDQTLTPLGGTDAVLFALAAN